MEAQNLELTNEVDDKNKRIFFLENQINQINEQLSNSQV
jgi:hypothetical protein